MIERTTGSQKTGGGTTKEIYENREEVQNDRELAEGKPNRVWYLLFVS